MLIFAMSGCTVTYQPEIGVDQTAVPTTDTTRYEVGIIFTADFRSYQHIYFYGGDHVFEVGPASVSMFEAVSRTLFRRVELLDSFPPVPSGNKELDFVIQFDSAHFWFRFGSPSRQNPRPDVSGVDYVVKLFTTSGELARTFHVTGHSSRIPGRSLAFPRARSSMESSLIDARDSFAENLRAAIAASLRAANPEMLPCLSNVGSHRPRHESRASSSELQTHNSSQYERHLVAPPPCNPKAKALHAEVVDRLTIIEHSKSIGASETGRSEKLCYLCRASPLNNSDLQNAIFYF